MNKNEQRKLALGAVRSKLRQQGIDPLTVSASHALAVLDDLARVEDTIATQWYLNANDNQVALFRREWAAWRKEHLRQSPTNKILVIHDCTRNGPYHLIGDKDVPLCMDTIAHPLLWEETFTYDLKRICKKCLNA